MNLRILFLQLFALQIALCNCNPVFSNDSLAFLSPYNSLLNRYVHEGESDGTLLNLVSYGHWKEDPLHKEAMQLLQASKPSKLSSNKEKLVFWINAYNLLTIDLIISKEEKESIRNLGSWFSSPWSIYKWKVGGSEYSLDDIEHDILRKLKEPRIHMAIVCASISCPDLRSEVFSVEKISSQLTDQTVRFLRNNKKGLKEKKDRFIASMIFKWFTEDFGGKSGVLSFLKEYHPVTNKEIRKISYLEYNWNLNGNW